ncbi:MAG: adenosylcobinamide-GDP ribazoletransferase [Anaerolineae bacterium]|nr:adenosylcobinamide-GDP ribazoletransferase [Thermoflexus sp.]MDW8064413.1 adenosylcobinamide-GDP ribazoletransferase [Anaerolineae bacterium]
MFRSILSALCFLTTLPLPRQEISLQDVGRGGWAFPIIGMMIGLWLVGADWLGKALFPLPLRAAMVLALWLAITGALHLDGFADCCDALLGARSPEERLRILRDPHIGAFGAAGVATLLLTKYAVLTVCLESGLWVGLWLAPTLGRWAMVYALVVYPVARPDGIGSAVKETTHRWTLWGATLTLSPMIAAYPDVASIALIVAWLFTVLFAAWVMRRLPGFTGDMYGALCELVEVIVLIALSPWRNR